MSDRHTANRAPLRALTSLVSRVRHGIQWLAHPTLAQFALRLALVV